MLGIFHPAASGGSGARGLLESLGRAAKPVQIPRQTAPQIVRQKFVVGQQADQSGQMLAASEQFG
jgi:hypothetical protein